MKKLLTILGAVGLMATTGATVVACGGDKKDDKEEKGAFPIEITSKTFDVQKEETVKITEFDKFKETYDVESLAVKTDQKEDAKVITVGTINKEKGEVVVTGFKKGTVKLQISAKPKAKPEKDEVDPVLSDSITITVNALKLSNLFKEKSLGEEPISEKTALDTVNGWISENPYLEGKVEATKVKDKNEIKVSVTEAGTGYVEGADLVFGYTAVTSK